MIIGFTGTRRGMSLAQKMSLESLLAAWPVSVDSEFHHGDCVGADAEAHAIVRKLGGRVIVGHPPVDPAHRAFCECDELRAPLPYLVRDAAIVIACGVLVATPAQASEQRRSGTWTTVRRARGAGRAVVIILPDGEYVMEGY